ncbi:hypothetical protein RHSIM_Rhsim11G0001300 [Rhododendron simsii]|uniref:Uncharacterized protein n=1 Tax=Rhododendron simsii TaxID=118357 RepID=A0A834G8T5_RHOSS|nr:hypothetical protein RHSIM_Rhsim11G0001300 [Rhododendron simsii]
MSIRVQGDINVVVEDIYRRRQPLPTMDAIYFMQPTKENSPVPRELVSHIKKDGSVLARIGALREMNLEYFAIDSQVHRAPVIKNIVNCYCSDLISLQQDFLVSSPPNINDNHRAISSLVHQLDIRCALDYDGIPGVIGTGLGRAAHILLDYHPTPKSWPTPLIPTIVAASAVTAPLRLLHRRGKLSFPLASPKSGSSGASSSGHVTHISPSDYFAEKDMSRRLNLAAMVGRSGSRPSSASHSSTPAGRATTSGSLPQAFLPMLVASDFLTSALLFSVYSKDDGSMCEGPQGDVAVTGLIAENARLLGENNKLDKRKVADANFTKAMEELGKAEENVRIFEENMSEAFNNGFDDASMQFEDRVPEGLDLTITEIEISDDEAGPLAPVVLPSTSVIADQQEVGSSSAVAAAADRYGPTHLPAPIDPIVQGNPTAPANPSVPVIDVGQEMIAPAA